MADTRRTVLNGVAWPDGTVEPIAGMYLGVQDPETLQFFPFPDYTLVGAVTGTSVDNVFDTTLTSTGVMPGTYTNANITVNEDGRITFASNGLPIPGVLSIGITGENGITSNGGPITSQGSIIVGLGDITPTSVSTVNIAVDGNLTFTGDARTIVADFSNSFSTNRTSFKSSTPNGQTIVIARPNGNSQTAGWEIENSRPDVGRAGSVFFVNSTTSGIQNYVREGGTQLPFILITGVGTATGAGTVGLMQDVIGNVSIGGDSPLEQSSPGRYLYINSMLGMPLSIPMAPIGNNGPQAGKTPVTVDLANNKFYFFTNGLWRNTNTPDYEEFSALPGQTIFDTQIRTVPKANGKSFLQVFVNGIFQQEGITKEYNVTGPFQITFSNGIAPGADVVIYGFA